MKTVEATSSVWPLPHCNFMPTTGCELSNRHAHMVSHRRNNGMRGAVFRDRDNQSRGESRGRVTALARDDSKSELWPPCRMQQTPDELLNSRSRTKPRDHEEKLPDEVREHPMLKRPPLITAAPKPHNARRYFEFHEWNGHTTSECWELRKALHEQGDKGQVDGFLKKGPLLPVDIRKTSLALPRRHNFGKPGRSSRPSREAELQYLPWCSEEKKASTLPLCTMIHW
ncbi:hypothetical protein Cgig2_011943 [Carnegiea gigantea]|uniref:Uncharacterized protein n=1 Tax=Carnegiea gigantea TaxID=171969 RepID=A0A9Q1GN15_9CARY|nr:hypothetical protein Cgig2_011943 [Carnegiea gigantea]